MSNNAPKVAFTHPGKHGDCIYALPTVKKLCEMLGTTADFYTSEYCAPLKPLFEYQSYIDHFYVSPNYVIERMDLGVQPYYVPVDRSLYYKVWHLGFRHVPDEAIHKFIGHSVGIEVDDPVYEVPGYGSALKMPYITISSRGETSYADLFREVIRSDPMRFVIVGGKGEYLGEGIDATGLDYLQTASIIGFSIGFIGIMSSQLCLANGFNIPKVIPHDGHSWDMNHVIYSDLHHYLVNPTKEQILGVFDAVLQND